MNDNEALRGIPLAEEISVGNVADEIENWARANIGTPKPKWEIRLPKKGHNTRDFTRMVIESLGMQLQGRDRKSEWEAIEQNSTACTAGWQTK